MFSSWMDWWQDLMSMAAARWVVWGTVLLMLIAVAWYVIGRLRGLMYESIPEPQSYLGTFQELREQGLLEEEEYQKLRKALSPNRTDLVRGREPDGLPPGPSAEGGGSGITGSTGNGGPDRLPESDGDGSAAGSAVGERP